MTQERQYEDRSRVQAIPLTLSLVGALVAVGWGELSSTWLARRLELMSIDLRFNLRGPRTPGAPIVIVEVDDASLEEFGPWPWPRSRLGRLAEILTAMGARAIVFDMLLSEKDEGPRAASSDRALVEATRRSGRVFHGAASAAGSLGRRTGAEALTHTLQRFALTGARVLPGGPLDAAASLPSFGDVLTPFEELAAASAGVGFVDVLASPDGVYRHYLPVVEHRGRLYPSLALTVAMHVLGIRPEQVTVRRGQWVQLGEARRVPIDRGGAMLIDFVGPPGTFQHLSAASVLRPVRPELRNAVQGKVVLVAATATGLYDLRASPFRVLSSGVQTQANALENMLSGRFLREQRPERVLIYTLGWAVVIGALMPRMGAGGQLCLSVALILGHLLIAYWNFAYRGVAMAVVTPTAGMALSLLLVDAHRLIMQEKEQERLRRAFGRFVPPEIVPRLTEDETSTVAGERRLVTVLFADIRGFTAVASRLDPEDTVALLNRYFQLMHEVILQFGGTLDKFVGDGLMAVWNVPVEQVDHAGLAVAAALEMQRRIKLNRDEWTFLGMPELAACMGISTGLAVAGYVGSPERTQYTVIGPEVNVASRLEGLAKQLGLPLVIGRPTYDLVVDLVEAEPLGRFTLHGIEGEVEAFAVTGLRSPADQQGRPGE